MCEGATPNPDTPDMPDAVTDESTVRLLRMWAAIEHVAEAATDSLVAHLPALDRERVLRVYRQELWMTVDEVTAAEAMGLHLRPSNALGAWS